MAPAWHMSLVMLLLPLFTSATAGWRHELLGCLFGLWDLNTDRRLDNREIIMEGLQTAYWL